MANLKASQKDIRRIAKRTERNRQAKSRLKTLRKKLDAYIAAGDSDNSKSAYSLYTSALDKAAKGNVVHKNVANRHKALYGKKLTTQS